MLSLHLQHEGVRGPDRPASYQVIVLGGGLGGLTAGLYTARAGLSTLLVEKHVPGGQAATTDLIENYPLLPRRIDIWETSSSIFERALRQHSTESAHIGEKARKRS